MIRRLALLATAAILLATVVAAANDPGHDTLYIEQTGNSTLTGNLNISDELRVANLLYSEYLNILGNGTNPGDTKPEIYATSLNRLYINAPDNIYLATEGGTMVYVGTSGSDLNVSQNLYVTGTIYQGGNAVQNDVTQSCSAGQAIQGINNDGTVNCTATSGASSGGGWTNTSTLISSNAGVNVTMDGGVLFVDATNNRVGVNTTTPGSTLTVSGNISSTGAIYAAGSQVCTASNGLCGSGSYSEWVLAAGNTSGSASVTNGTTVNITGGTGITVTRSGTTIEINSSASVSEATVEGYVYDADNTLGAAWTVGTDDTYDITFDGGTFFVDADVDRVGVGTATPAAELEVSNGSQSLTVDASTANMILLNTTGGVNATITSAGGSVIIQLG